MRADHFINSPVGKRLPNSWYFREEHHLEHSAPSVRALKIFDITQVTATKTLQFRHAVLGPG
jgi:hypothetical protein